MPDGRALGNDVEARGAVLEDELGRPGQAFAREPATTLLVGRGASVREGEPEAEVLRATRQRRDAAVQLEIAREPERVQEVARRRALRARPVREDLVARIGNRREERGIHDVAGVGELDLDDAVATSLPVARNAHRARRGEDAARGRHRAQAAAADLDRLVEDGDGALLQAERIGEAREDEPRVADIDPAGDEDGLPEAGGRVDAHVERAAAAEREGARGERALEPLAAGARGRVVGEARELLALRDERGGVGQEARPRETFGGARVEEHLERAARLGFERGEEALVDGRVGAGDAEIDLGARRDAREAAVDLDDRAVGAAARDPLDDDVVALEADDAVDALEPVREFLERRRALGDAQRPRRTQRRRRRAVGKAAFEPRFGLERPLGDGEVGEDLRDAARNEERARGERVPRRRERRDAEREPQRRERDRLLEPRLAALPGERAGRQRADMEPELAGEGDGEDGFAGAGTIVAGCAEEPLDAFERESVGRDAQRSLRDREPRRRLDVDARAVAEAAPRVAARVVAEEFRGQVDREALDVDLGIGLAARGDGEARAHDPPREVEPLRPEPDRRGGDGQRAVRDREIAQLDRDRAAVGVDRAGDRADGEAALGIGAALEEEAERAGAVAIGRERAAEAHLAELREAAVRLGDAALDDEVVDRDARRALAAVGRAAGGFRGGERLEAERVEFVRALGEAQAHLVDRDRLDDDIAEEECERIEADPHAVARGERARVALPVGRLDREPLDDELVPRAERDPVGGRRAADRARGGWKDDRREDRRPREDDARDRHRRDERDRHAPTPAPARARDGRGRGGVRSRSGRIGRSVRGSGGQGTHSTDVRAVDGGARSGAFPRIASPPHGAFAGLRVVCGRPAPGAYPARPMPDPIHPAGPRDRAPDAPPLAVVTGAARRVGRAIALELARQGFDLVLTYRHSREACEATAREVVAVAADAGSAGRVAHAIELDLADAASLAGATDAIAAIVGARKGGALDALVHNASDYEASAFGAIDAAILERQHRTEVVGPLLLTQSLAPALARSTREGGAAVVLFGDLHSVGRPRPGYAAYTLAKAGARMLCEQLAVELAPLTRVHCIAPSVVMLPEGFPDEVRERILARTPLGRLGTPEECARLVRFLVCEATFLTGGTIRIDGGRGLR